MLIAVDGPNLAWRMYHTMGQLSHDDVSTGVAFGFISSIITMAEERGTNNFAFAWDSLKSHRKRLCPIYKQNRRTEDKEEIGRRREVNEQISDLRLNLLPAIGFRNQFLQTGCEADDILARLAKMAGDPPLEKMVVVSSDNDMIQILRPGVYLYRPSKNEMLSESKVEQVYNISPAQWADVKMLAGCTSDNVQGVPGVGEKTAIKYLKGELKQGKKFEALSCAVNDTDFVARNTELVTLPHPKCRQPELRRNAIDLARLWEVCEDMGFDSLLEPAKWARIEKALTGVKEKKG